MASVPTSSTRVVDLAIEASTRAGSQKRFGTFCLKPPLAVVRSYANRATSGESTNRAASGESSGVRAYDLKGRSYGENFSTLVGNHDEALGSRSAAGPVPDR